MQLRKEYPFERQKALEVCYEYYQRRGCPLELCHQFLDHLEDWKLESVVGEIYEEWEKYGKQEGYLLQRMVATAKGTIQNSTTFGKERLLQWQPL